MDIVLNTVFNNPNLPAIPVPGIYDDFERPAADVLGKTREGKAWLIHDYGTTSSVWGTNGDGTASMKSSSSGYHAATVDSLVADGTLTGEVGAITAGVRYGGLMLRYQDMDNFIYVGETSSTDQRISILHRTAGTQGNLAVSQHVPVTADAISIDTLGPAIIVRVNGAQILSIASDKFVGKTRRGLYAFTGTNASWKKLEFTPA